MRRSVMSSWELREAIIDGCDVIDCAPGVYDGNSIEVVSPSKKRITIQSTGLVEFRNWNIRTPNVNHDPIAPDMWFVPLESPSE